MILLTPCNIEARNVSHWLSKQEENVTREMLICAQNHINARKMRSEILAPVKLPGALTSP